MASYVMNRLHELGIYSDYYYRLEIRVLEKLIYPDETLNCILTGLIDGRRQMLAVTDYRIILVSSSVMGGSNGNVIKRSAVKNWKFNKKFLFSNVEIETEDRTFVLRNTQGKMCRLFTAAMNEPVKQFDE